MEPNSPVVRRAELLGDKLAEDLTATLRRLEDLTDKIREKEEQVKGFKLEDRSVVMAVLSEKFAKEGRKSLRQQLFFALIIGFMVGLIVNWVSSPILDVIRRVVHL